MRLTELCIRRPVLATVMNLVLILIGVIAFDRLQVREFPRSDEPIVQINTIYTGASAALMETQVTTRIEDALAGIEGIDVLRSKSMDNVSEVTVEFVAGYDFAEGLNDIRDKLGAIRGDLPVDADPPIVIKADADATPIMYLSINDPSRSALEISDYVDRFIKTDVEQTEGVASVAIFGERRYAMRAWLDPFQMGARRVTVGDMRDALLEQTVELPGGEIKSVTRNFVVLPQTQLGSQEEYNRIVIRNEDGYLVRFGDVADVVVAPEDTEGGMRLNGTVNTIGLGVIPQTTANPVDVARAVRAEIERIRRGLPPGMDISVNYDKTIFIEESINRVYRTLFEAVILVSVVVFLFLGTLRATSIPLVTIPVCLISVFGLMLMLGYTINNMTLLAMVLAIGLVVDDAIVMLENIHRHIEEGMKPFEAAIKGSGEIAFAIIAMTITLAAVYAPIGFTQGFTGDLLREFAYTLAGAVLISGFVALTLTPAMCARLLKGGAKSRYSHWLEESFVKLDHAYEKALRYFLAHRYIVGVILVVVAGGGYYFFDRMPSELAPLEDQGVVLTIIEAPTDSNYVYTDSYSRQVEALFDQVPEKERFLLAGGFPTPSNGYGVLILKPWRERERTQSDIVQDLGPKMYGIPGVQAFPINFNPLSRGGNKDIVFVIRASASYEELNTIVQHFIQLAQKNPGLANIDSVLRIDSTQFEVDIDRDRAADLGVIIEDISVTLATMLGGGAVTEFEYDGRLYDVIFQVNEADQVNPDIINQMYVTNENEDMIPLSSLVEIREVVKPKDLQHWDRLRSGNVRANLAAGYTTSEAIEFFEQLAAEHLPANAQYAWGGDARRYLQSSGSLYLIFVLALVFIYLVLAAQFESFRDPFIILLTVPLSMAGALAMLTWAGGTLNIYSQIGLVTLIGLISKHGILITEFANQLQERGTDLVEAAIQGAKMRLRPILMTTGAMVLGAVPLALATGPGAMSRQAIGWVIVGGLGFGTLFTLFVIPVAYSLLARRHSSMTNAAQ